MEADEVQKGLTSFIGRQTGARKVEIENLVRLSGGASRETWAFDATLEEGDGKRREELIFRCDPFEGTSISAGRALEHALICAAWKAGVVVPEPRWNGDGTFGVKFLVMRRVPGETLGSRLIRGKQYGQARRVLPGQLAASLARIHTIRRAAHPELGTLPGPEPGIPPAKNEVELWEKHYRESTPNPHPVVEIAFRWLRAHLPQPGPETLVHGDYRLGNFLYTEEGLQGVVDWELAHWGDPVEDLGWLSVRSWRFGGKGPVAGLASREEFLRLYEEAGGPPVDRDRLRFWEVFGNLRWGVITVAQAMAYLSGRSKSVELAAIGRRTAETEVELLNLIEEAN